MEYMKQKKSIGSYMYLQKKLDLISFQVLELEPIKKQYSSCDLILEVMSSK